jgi:orotate phosphoribosyltransferase
MRESKLVSWLFETTAFRVCPPKKPFWYTSGTIGPYYINTHFLYGSEKKANELLAFIDAEKGDKAALTYKLLEKTKVNYENDAIYKGLIDFMIDFIKEKVDVEKIDYVSGGERRDWFFSIIVAEILNKPHITIFKDLDAYVGNVTEKEFKKASSLNGARVLHIADLITEASSYERAWVPAINAIGGKLTDSVVVVDRMQGGGLILEGLGVNSHAMISIDESLFGIALKQGLINEEQNKMLAAYFHNPKESMKNFLMENKAFLEEALKGDAKTAERAKLMIEKDLYGLNE